MTSSVRDFGPGSLIAGYRLEEKLGEGGMGVVYIATQISLNRTVALKLLSPTHAADLAFRERFRREGLMQAALDHPNIVTVFEAGEFDGVLFIAMRLVTGSSLKELILGRTLSPARTLRILGPVADALDAAHELGLIHRDVKPHNVLVGRRDRGFLADFGLTKSRDGSSMTQTGQFVGSLDYVAPEQIRGDEVTARTDIYALGAVLFESLTGAVPFPKSSDAAVLYAHLSDPPPRATERRPSLPPAIDAVLERALAKQPEDRYAHAVDLLEDAQAAFAGVPGSTGDAPSALEPADRGIRSPEAEVATRAPEVLQETLPPRPVVDIGSTSAASDVSAAPEHDRNLAPRRRRALAAASVLFIALAGVIAYLVGDSGKNPPPRSHLASSGLLTVTAPNGWRHKDPAGTVAGLEFKDAITLQNPMATGMIAAGELPAAVDRTLIPATLTRLVSQTPRPDDPVRLGGVRGYRYADLQIKGQTGLSTVYVAPTSKGIIGVACTGPVAVRRACENIATTLTLHDATPLALGPDQDYARAVDAAVAKLAGVRGDVLRLRAASRRATQARLLEPLAARYEAAAKQADMAEPGPEAKDAAKSFDVSLRATAKQYRAMAAAAKGGQATAYRRARTGASRATRDVSKALTVLAAFGYGRLS